MAVMVAFQDSALGPALRIGTGTPQMYTIVKLGFWFGLVLFFMPLGNSEAETAPQVGAVQALYAIKVAVEDVRDICDRQPRVCDTGGAAFRKIGMSARESARVAFNYLDAHYGSTDNSVTATEDDHQAPGAPAAAKAEPVPASQ